MNQELFLQNCQELSGLGRKSKCLEIEQMSEIHATLLLCRLDDAWIGGGPKQQGFTAKVVTRFYYEVLPLPFNGCQGFTPVGSLSSTSHNLPKEPYLKRQDLS